MREGIILDDPTGIENNTKQESLDIIRTNIDNILQYGEQNTIINEIVRDISLQDIDDYLEKLIINQDLFSKIPLLTSFPIDNLKLFNALCEYTDVYEVKYPKKGDQKIYFLSSADFAITIIPIALENNEINIYIEPLESSPEFIKQIWKDIKDRDSIDNIKFVDYRTLEHSNKG